MDRSERMATPTLPANQSTGPPETYMTAEDEKHVHEIAKMG
jgi:hypothetical protein